MEIIEPLVKRFLLYFFLSPVAIFFNLLFLARTMVFFTLELVKPARSVSYGEVWRDDCFAYFGFAFLVTPIVSYFYLSFPNRFSVPLSPHGYSLALRFVLYLLLADFGHYWAHRLLHTSYFWPAHKWHHSPTYMYWLAGVRGTVPQQLLVFFPYVVFGTAFLQGVPPWIILAIGTFHSVQNDWMHVNFTWRSHWMEWTLVTPRYHHIHHSDNPKHYGANLGVTFTFWDRLFGTYLDPTTIGEELSFGIDSQDNPVRVVLGV